MTYFTFNLASYPRAITSTNSFLDKWGMMISDLEKFSLEPRPSIVYTHIVDVRVIMGILICIPINISKIIAELQRVILCIIPETFNFRRGLHPVQFSYAINKIMITET